jgi:hypothetical protein
MVYWNKMAKERVEPVLQRTAMMPQRTARRIGVEDIS